MKPDLKAIAERLTEAPFWSPIQADVAALLSYVVELENQLRWRDVREELPEKDGVYDAKVYGSRSFPAGWDGEHWRSRDAGMERVTHWRPIPPDPEEER